MFELVFEGADALAARLGLLSNGLEDQQVPLRRDAEILARSEMDTFAQGGRPDGWAAITEETRQRRLGDKDAPPLWDTGNLAKLAASTADSETLGARSETTVISQGELIKTITGPDVEAHQMGNPDRNLPQREFFLIQPQDEAEIVAVHEDYIRLLIADGSS